MLPERRFRYSPFVGRPASARQDMIFMRVVLLSQTQRTLSQTHAHTAQTRMGDQLHSTDRTATSRYSHRAKQLPEPLESLRQVCTWQRLNKTLCAAEDSTVPSLRLFTLSEINFQRAASGSWRGVATDAQQHNTIHSAKGDNDRSMTSATTAPADDVLDSATHQRTAD